MTSSAEVMAQTNVHVNMFPDFFKNIHLKLDKRQTMQYKHDMYHQHPFKY